MYGVNQKIGNTSFSKSPKDKFNHINLLKTPRNTNRGVCFFKKLHSGIGALLDWTQKITKRKNKRR